MEPSPRTPDPRAAGPGPGAPPIVPRPSPAAGFGEKVLAGLRRGRPHLGSPPLSLVALGSAVLATALLGAVLVTRTPPTPATEALLPYAAGSAPDGPPSATTLAPVGPGAADGPATTAAPALVTVHAAGAVRSPGVYTLAAGARIADALAVAGGSAGDADLERVNLAAPLADGQRVYIPHAGRTVPEVVADPTGEAVSERSGATVGGTAAVVDLNAATVAQLDGLPGVGPATAAAIVAYRQAHGSFRSVTQLLEVPGIGDAKLAALRARVRV